MIQFTNEETTKKNLRSDFRSNVEDLYPKLFAGAGSDQIVRIGIQPKNVIKRKINLLN